MHQPQTNHLPKNAGGETGTENERLARWLSALLIPAADIGEEEHAKLFQQLPNFAEQILTYGTLNIPARYGPLLYHLIACDSCRQAYLESYDALRAAYSETVAASHPAPE